MRELLASPPRSRAHALPPTRAFAQRRFALERWLDAHAGAPLRVVVGPAGAGKTTAVALWARYRREGPPLWVTLPARCSAEELTATMIAALFGRPARGGAALDLIVDGIDQASDEARGALSRLPGALPTFVNLVYLLRTPIPAPDSAPEVPTFTATAPPALLNFDLDEVRACADARAIATTPEDCATVLRTTGGRADEVIAIVRLASATGASLVDVCSRARAPVRLPNRSSGSLEPALVEVFGRFRMRFGACEVQFARRRDRQIIQYLALRPGAAATRAELVDAFWPGARRTDAARRLRTACSTIRRAISACVGEDALDAYFRTEGATVTLCPANLVNELTSFEGHIESARRAGERGQTAVAREHFAAALALHERPLLSGEAPAPWIAQRASACEQLAEFARQSLLAIDAADIDTSRSA